MTCVLGDCEVSIQCKSPEKMTALYQAMANQYIHVQETVSEELSLTAQLARALNRFLFPSGTEQQDVFINSQFMVDHRGQTSVLFSSTIVACR